MTSVAAALIVGIWKYEAYRYRGQIKTPSSTANLTYELKTDATDRLYWEVDGPGQFCERFGTYKFENGVIYDQITATNPENHHSCSSDPDMQVGRETQTAARLENEKLILQLPLGDESLEAIFGRTDNP